MNKRFLIAGGVTVLTLIVLVGAVWAVQNQEKQENAPAVTVSATPTPTPSSSYTPFTKVTLTPEVQSTLQETAKLFVFNIGNIGYQFPDYSFRNVDNTLRGLSGTYISKSDAYGAVVTFISQRSPIYDPGYSSWMDTTRDTSFSQTIEGLNVEVPPEGEVDVSGYPTVTVTGTYTISQNLLEYLGTEAGGERAYNKLSSYLRDQTFELVFQQEGEDWKIYDFTTPEDNFFALSDEVSGNTSPFTEVTTTTIYP